MFREMRRKKQAIDETACLEILKKEKRGVLCMTADGWPYGIPMDHVLLDGKLYFHCAKAGKKLEALREDDRVCYTVTGEGQRGEGWPLHFESVLVFGRMREIRDSEMIWKVCRALTAKFTDEPEYAEKEWAVSGTKLSCLEITPEHITGKKVTEQ